MSIFNFDSLYFPYVPFYGNFASASIWKQKYCFSLFLLLFVMRCPVHVHHIGKTSIQGHFWYRFIWHHLLRNVYYVQSIKWFFLCLSIKIENNIWTLGIGEEGKENETRCCNLYSLNSVIEQHFKWWFVCQRVQINTRVAGELQ